MGAIFDKTGRYRYSLWREWDERLPRIAFVMLNPSTADAVSNDPTIHRCICFAQSWGYGSLEVVNLFAYRATEPRSLKLAKRPVGKENDRYLLEAVQRCDRTVLAWGNWGTLQERDRLVLELLRDRFHHLYCLGMTQANQPRHPLYLKATTELIAFEAQSTAKHRSNSNYCF